MKNYFVREAIGFAICFVMMAVFFVMPQQTQALSLAPCPDLTPGRLFKVKGISTIYLLNENEERLFFRNSDVYHTRYSSYAYVSEIDDWCVDEYPVPSQLPFAATFRPGSRLVTTPTTNDVYAVLPEGKLMKLANEVVAAGIYGKNWATLVRDVSDAFLVNYSILDSSIFEIVPHEGMYIREQGNSQIYFVEDYGLQRVSYIPAYAQEDIREFFSYVVSTYDIFGKSIFNAVEMRPVDSHDHKIGSPNPIVTIVEYSDLQGPFSRRFHGTMHEIIENYGDDVQWVFRHFPIDSLHPQARKQAIASECAADQGKFWEFIGMIYAEQDYDFDLNKLDLFAEDLGMNIEQFTYCVDSEKYAPAVVQDEEDAARAGAIGVPYSVLLGPDGEMIPISGAQPYSALEIWIKNFL